MTAAETTYEHPVALASAILDAWRRGAAVTAYRTEIGSAAVVRFEIEERRDGFLRWITATPSAALDAIRIAIRLRMADRRPRG